MTKDTIAGESRDRDLFPYGYGRGWSEPLAVGRWSRFWQMMREPVTTNRLWCLIAVTVAGFVALEVALYFWLAP